MNKIRFNYSPIASITKDKEVRIFSLINSCFSYKDKTPEEKKEHDDKFCSRNDRIGLAFATTDSRIVGAVIAYKRKIKYKGKELILGGIGGVCTKDGFRRQGVATHLISIVMEKLKEKDCDICYLCTDTEKLAGLYATASFQILKENYTYLGKSGKRFFDSGGMLAPLNSPDIFLKILKSKEPLDIGIGDW